jgi:trk system potassium uptake protein TrkA
VFNIEVSKRGAGDAISALKLADFDLRCLGLMRGTKFFDGSQPDLLMQVGDLLLILGRRVDLRRFSDSLA